MATVVSSQITAHGYTLASYLTYEVTTNNATTYTVSVKGGIRIYTARLHMSSSTATSAVSGTGQTTASATASVYNPTASTYDQEYVSTSYTWTKGAAANKTISNKISFSSSSYFSGQTATASATITVPAKTYTVSYNANGGSGAPASQTKTHGVTLTLSSTKPTRTGYTFKGWATSSTSTTVAYAAGASYTGNANLSLYAVWQINTWTVTYNANGGSGSIANQTKTYNQALTLSNGAGFTRSLYNLVGWATSAGGAKAYNLGGSYTGNAALNLYAVWELAYVKPIINNFACYRVETSGSTTETDDGEYIYISFDYVGGEVGGSAVNPTVVITIGGATVYDTAQTSATGTITQWFGTYSKDNAFSVSVKVYDSNYPTGTTKTATIQTAIYLIDALGSGTDVYAGVMHPAVSGQKLTLPDTKVDGSLGVATSATLGTWLYVGTNASVQGTFSAGSVSSTGAISGSSVSTTGAVSAGSVSASGALSGASLTTTGNISASGSATATGFTVKGHGSTIGTGARVAGTAQTFSSSGSWQSASSSNSVTLAAGSWLIIFTGVFSANGTTGTRAIRPNAGGTAFAYGQSQITPSNNNQHTLTCVFVDTTSASKTYYAEIYQNGGSSESITVHIQYMRIA